MASFFTHSRDLASRVNRYRWTIYAGCDRRALSAGHAASLNAILVLLSPADTWFDSKLGLVSLTSCLAGPASVASRVDALWV